MEDRVRKVIKGLKCLGGDGERRCSDCPYHGKGLKPCRIAICEDAESVIRELGTKLGNVMEDFVDFATSGIPNLAPFCANRSDSCVDERGWCIHEYRGPCQGFDPKVRDDG